MEAPGLLKLWSGVAALLWIGVAPVHAAAPRSDPTNDPDSLLVQARALSTLGRADQADSIAAAAAALLESRHGPRSIEVARALDVRVLALQRSSHSGSPESETVAERAVSIKRALAPPDSLDLATSLSYQGALRFYAGNYPGATAALEEALRIQGRGLRPNQPATAYTVHSLANVAYQTGDLARARALYARALGMRETSLGPDDPATLSTIVNLASLCVDLGDYETSHRLFERAVAVGERVFPPDHPELARHLDNFSTLLREEGDFARAKSLTERALAIRERALGPAHGETGVSLVNVGDVRFSMGDLQGARSFYERGLATLLQAYGSEDYYYLLSLTNLGELMHAMGDDSASARTLGQSVTMQERAYGPDHQNLAQALVNHGKALQAIGRYDSAGVQLARAVAVTGRAFGAEHFRMSEALSARASWFDAAGRADSARDCHARAQVIREAYFGPRHPEVGAGLARFAAFRWAHDDTIGVMGDALRAEAIGRDHLRITARASSERRALLYAASRASGIDLALSVLRLSPSRTGAASVLDALIRSRAIVLDEMAARRHDVFSASDPAVRLMNDSLALARARLANLRMRAEARSQPGYRTLVEAADAERQRCEERLAERSAPFRRARERENAGLPEIARALPPGSALLSFVRYSARLPAAGTAHRVGAAAPLDTLPSFGCFVLAQGEEAPRFVPLGSASDIEELVERWRSVAARTPRNPVEARSLDEGCWQAGDALRRRVWDPCVAGIESASKLFVVPDGSLNLVNLGALPSDRSHFLVEGVPVIATLSTERDLLVAPAGPHGRGGLFAMGAPDFDGRPESGSRPVATRASFRGTRSDCGAFASLRFAPLPGCRAEVRGIAAAWKRSGPAAGPIDTLIGAAATEAALKLGAAGHRVVHLATHGFFFGEHCGSTRELPGGENPMLLSGLVLAGANRRASASLESEDGILTAEEIGALDFTGVEWVVLSACDTGLGVLSSGEGVFGLKRAIAVTGARTTVMSLWKVEDHAARRWMEALYAARFAGGMATAEAMRSANLEILRRLRARGASTHPSSWGAFIAAGDWR